MGNPPPGAYRDPREDQGRQRGGGVCTGDIHWKMQACGVGHRDKRRRLAVREGVGNIQVDDALCWERRCGAGAQEGIYDGERY